MQIENRARPFPWRLVIWGGAALLLLIPALAMQVTSEMNWGPGDFAILGAMLLAACSAWEVTRALTAHGRTRTIVGLAIVAAFLLIWAELAVGIFGPG